MTSLVSGNVPRCVRRAYVSLTLPLDREGVEPLRSGVALHRRAVEGRAAFTSDFNGDAMRQCDSATYHGLDRIGSGWSGSGLVDIFPRGIRCPDRWPTDPSR